MSMTHHIRKKKESGFLPEGKNQRGNWDKARSFKDDPIIAKSKELGLNQWRTNDSQLGKQGSKSSEEREVFQRKGKFKVVRRTRVATSSA